MKKIFLFLLAMSFTAIGFAQLNAGLGLIYGTEIEQLGLAVKGQYDGIAENIDGSVGLHFFFPDKSDFSGGELKSSLTTINLDGHYNFDAAESFNIYALAGLNFAIIKVKFDSNTPFVPSSDESESEIGLNLGAGASTDINETLKGFAELKYTVSDFDQLVIAIGILMAF